MPRTPRRPNVPYTLEEVRAMTGRIRRAVNFPVQSQVTSEEIADQIRMTTPPPSPRLSSLVEPTLVERCRRGFDVDLTEPIGPNYPTLTWTITCATCDRRARFGSCSCSRCRYCRAYIHNANREDHERHCLICNTCFDCMQTREHNTCGTCGTCGTFSECSHGACNHSSCCYDICRDCHNCIDHCTCPGRHSYVQGYSSHKYPVARPSEALVPSSFLYLGVELETEVQQDRGKRALNLASEAIYNQFKDYILQKEDGSLSHGIELVTGKLSLKEHQKLWPQVCDVCVDNHLRSWKHRTTGLHVHMNRAFFTPLTIGKLLCFVNSDNRETSKNIVKLAGRNSDYGERAKKYLKNTVQAINHSRNRYEAVNLTNDHTIEIRIFKGTLKATRVLACIEFCHAAAYYVTQCSIKDMESWTGFMMYVKKQGRLYRNLINFFEPGVIQPVIVRDSEQESDAHPAPSNDTSMCAQYGDVEVDEEGDPYADCYMPDDIDLEDN